MEKTNYIFAILIIGILLMGMACINSEKTREEQLVKKNSNLVNNYEQNGTNKTEKEKESNKLDCKFKNKKESFEGVTFYYDSEDEKLTITGYNGDYRIIIKSPWNETGIYGYEKAETEPDITLYEKTTSKNKKMYVLEYDENFTLNINITNKTMDGSIGGNLAELGKWDVEEPIECEFYGEMKEEKQ